MPLPVRVSATLLAASLATSVAATAAAQEVAPQQYQQAAPAYEPPAAPQAPYQQVSPPASSLPALQPPPPPPPGYVVQPIPQHPSESMQVAVVPRYAPNWADGEPIPPGFHKREHIRGGFVAGGATLFGSLYLITTLGAAIAQENGSNSAALYIPVFGPFVQMGSTSSPVANWFLCVDGIAQAAGAAMFIYGLASPKVELVRDDYGKSKLELGVVPVVAGGQAGASVVGRF